MTVAGLPAKLPARRPRRCCYCGEPTLSTRSDTCPAHRDLPKLEPAAALARQKAEEELESSPHRSNPREESHDAG